MSEVGPCVVSSWYWTSRRREWILRREDRRGTFFRVSGLNVQWSCQHISWTKQTFLVIALPSWPMDNCSVVAAPCFSKTSMVCSRQCFDGLSWVTVMASGFHNSFGDKAYREQFRKNCRLNTLKADFTLKKSAMFSHNGFWPKNHEEIRRKRTGSISTSRTVNQMSHREILIYMYI